MKAFCAITCLLWLLTGPGLQAQELPVPVQEALERATSSPWTDRYDELYDVAELQLGAVRPLYDELLRRASAAEHSAAPPPPPRRRGMHVHVGPRVRAISAAHVGLPDGGVP